MGVVIPNLAGGGVNLLVEQCAFMHRMFRNNQGVRLLEHEH